MNETGINTEDCLAFKKAFERAIEGRGIKNPHLFWRLMPGENWHHEVWWFAPIGEKLWGSFIKIDPTWAHTEPTSAATSAIDLLCEQYLLTVRRENDR